MRGETRQQGAFDRLARLVSILAVALTLAGSDLAIGTGSAVAQEGPGGLFGRLFGGGRPRRYIDAPRDADNPPPRYYLDPPNASRPARQTPQQKRRNAARKAAPDRASPSTTPTVTATAKPAAEPVAKAPDAKVVLVVGDFLGLSLAKGLEASLADKADVRIVDRTDGSSGLVRDDHFNWPDRICAIIDEEKPVAVAVMLGANDRQAIRVDGASMELRSEDWAAEYERRMDALVNAVGDKKLPLLWVGLPAFKSQKMSDDVAYFNELYRQASTKAGGEFVDVWDGFVDANGAFASSGPDVAGQPAKLRNSDGITMTPQGARKLAFFTEKPLSKILGKSFGTGADSLLPNASSKGPPPNPANATSTPLIALNDPSLDGGELLLGGSKPVDKPVQPSPRDMLVTSGTPIPAANGRADDFAWNKKTGPVGPPQPNDSISRGSLDLKAVRGGFGAPLAPPKPMPTLQDAILDDWAAQQKAGETGSGESTAKPTSPAAALP